MNKKEMDVQRAFYPLTSYRKFREATEDIVKNGANENNLIIKIIDSVVLNSNQFVKTIQEDTVLFRARKVDIDDFGDDTKGLNGTLNTSGKGSLLFTKGYDYENSRECPLRKSNNGRSNIKGMSFLYAAEDVETACAEIDTVIRDIISVATFKTKQKLRIIDFKTDDKGFTYDENDEYKMSLATFITELMFSFCQPTSKEEDYLVTQEISDYIRKAGFDGIAYRSFYTGSTNYVIFNSHKSKVFFDNSRLIIYEHVEKKFYDCNNGKQIVAKQPKKENESVARVIALHGIIKKYKSKK